MIGIITALATQYMSSQQSKDGKQQQQQQPARKTLAQSFMEGALSPQARERRGSETAKVTARGKVKNQEIIDFVQRQLELAYRDPEAAGRRIFKDYV